MLDPLKKYFWPLCCGFFSGATWQLDSYARGSVPEVTSFYGLVSGVIVVGLGFACLVSLSRWWTIRLINESSLPLTCRTRWLRSDAFLHTVLLLPFLGCFGLRFDASGLFVMAAIFVFLKIVLIWRYRVMSYPDTTFSRSTWLPLVFLLSGFAALVYQVVWQRYLLTILGVNIESVTLVVSLFMLGLGVGALSGGYLSLKLASRKSLLLTFVCCELLIGLIGLFSVRYFQLLQGNTEFSISVIAALALLYLFVPTLFMGATLPMLVAYLRRGQLSVGVSVGWLYCGSTFGSALACFATAHLMFLWLGLQASVVVAAGLNLFVACVVLIQWQCSKRLPMTETYHGG